MVKRFLVLLIAMALLSACATQPEAEAAPLTEQEVLGQRVYTQNCAACHATMPGTTIVGPTLFNIGETAATRVEGQDAQTYITLSIIDPSIYLNEGFADLMPKTFGRTLSGEELDALIAYLLTLE